MIERWMEDFTLLGKQSAPDQLGGTAAIWADSLPFRGVLTLITGKDVSMGGQMVLQEDPVLLHDFDVTLSPGDHVRREKDGAVYRVTGRSGSMRAPAWSDLLFAQVPVERVVLP